MGNMANLCGGDPFQQLMDKYGGDVSKFFVAEKGKEAANEKFSDLHKQSDEVFAGFEGRTSDIAKKYNGELTSVFEQLKSQANNALPGGVPALEKQRGKSVAEITGFAALQGQVEAIKGEALKKIADKRAGVNATLESQQAAMLNEISSKQPRIPLYDQLPQPIKAKVLEQAEAKFSEQIKTSNGALLSTIASKFNVAQLGNSFNELSPESALKSLLGSAEGQFLSGLGLGPLAGGNIGGALSNMAGNMGGFGNTIKSFF